MLAATTGAAEPRASDPFPEVVPGVAIEFPRDEGSHPEFRIEWWYVTGWLTRPSGEPLGFQVTFFRTRIPANEANPSRFAVDQLLFAHAALSDPEAGSLRHDGRIARAGFGLAEAAVGATRVVLEDWSLVQDGTTYRARIDADGFAFELDFARRKPPLLHGQDGYSRKGPDPASASYYYTLPQLAVTGSVRAGGESVPVNGIAWLDHEWSSQILDPEATGWDWIGINLEDGGAIMGFRLRDARGEAHWAAGTILGAGGEVATFGPDEVEWRPRRRWTSPRTGIDYPVEFDVRIGPRRLHIEPLLDDQESDARASTGTVYWEGAVRALDAEGRLRGRGYLELTGYGERLQL